MTESFKLLSFEEFINLESGESLLIDTMDEPINKDSLYFYDDNFFLDDDLKNDLGESLNTVYTEHGNIRAKGRAIAKTLIDKVLDKCRMKVISAMRDWQGKKIIIYDKNADDEGGISILGEVTRGKTLKIITVVHGFDLYHDENYKVIKL